LGYAGKIGRKRGFREEGNVLRQIDRMMLEQRGKNGK
jgi:hypothetical protein